MSKVDQLALFEPTGLEALSLMKRHATDFERFQDEADMWDMCLCPGARDQAISAAQKSFDAWQVCAILLDLEREAGL